MTAKVRLGDVVQIVGGGTPDRSNPDYWGGSIPWVSVKDIQSDRITGSLEMITTLGLKKSASNLIPSGCIVIPTRMALGKAAINDVPIAINQDLKALIVNSAKIDRDFLHRYLLSKAAYFEARGKGATVKGITLDVLTELDIPKLPLAEQRRIAAILDKADAIRKKRSGVVATSEEFLRSSFLELFGDPVTNSKKLPEKPISELATVTTGNTPSREIETYFGDHIEWIKSDNINTPSHFLTKSTEGLSEAGLKVARSAPAGSTLVTCIAGSPSCIGNAALADRKVAFNQQINALTPKPGVEPEFIYAATLFSKRRIQAASTNGMKGMVSKGALEQVRFIFPPSDQREKFVGIFRKIVALTEKLDSAAREADALYGSLAQRAFQGQL